MALTVGELVGFIDLDDSKYNAKVDRAGGTFDGLGRKIATAAAAAAAAAAASIGALAIKGVTSFASLQSGMNEVFTLLPGISQDAMGKMTGQVKQFSKDFGVLPDDVVPALYQSLSAGVPQDNVFEFLETAQKAAKGGVTDLTTAVDGISSVVNSYGADVMDATKASDLMFTAVRLGKTDFSQLSSTLYNVLPTAAALGVGFEDVTAAIATMTAQGIPTAQATTMMRQAFVELSKDGTKTSDLFQKLSGKTFKEFVASGGNTQEALQLLEKHAEKTGVGINDLFGSVEAGGAALALTGGATDSFTSNLDAMQDSAGATEGAFQQMDQGLSSSFDKIKAQAAVMVTEFGEKLAPTVQGVADWFVTNMPAIQAAVENAVAGIASAVGTGIDLFQRFQTPITVVSAILLASYVPSLVAAATATTVNMAKKVAAWMMMRAVSLASIAASVAGMVAMVAKYAWMGVQSMLHAAKVAASWVIAMGPVGWVIALVVGLVALIIANWDKIKEATSRIWGAMTSWLKTTAENIRAWVSEKVAALVSGVTGFFGSMRDFVIGAAGAIRDRVVGFFTAMRDLIVGAATGARDLVVGAFTALKDSAIERAQALLDWVTGLPGRILSGLGNVGQLLVGAGRSILDGLWNGLKQKWEDVKAWVGGLGDKIKNLKGPIEVDRKLLTGEGSAIIAGLQRGMAAEWSSVERWLSSRSGAIAGSMTVPAGGLASRGAGAGTLVLEVDGRRFAETIFSHGVSVIQLEAS